MGDVGPLVCCVACCGLVELWVGVCGSSVSGSGCVNRGSGQKPEGFWPLPLGCVVAVSYSPTTYRLQYHRRCRA